MLKFYYNPISGNARRVWVALLEKQIPFEPVLLKLDDDQFQPEFTKINPLQRIPVVVDEGLRVVESLAILDYLEAKHPSPSLMPQDAREVAIVRMVEMVAVNELQPAFTPLTKQMMQLEVASENLSAAQQRITNVLQFYENLLGDKPYFAGEKFTLAEVVAGTLLGYLGIFGVSLDAYPKLNAWLEKLQLRDSWQQTTLAPEQIAGAIENVKKILQRRGNL